VSFLLACTLITTHSIHQFYTYKCIYVEFQSMEDWRQGTDILRINESFFGSPRYDTILVNTDDLTLRHARLELAFRIELSEKEVFDLALVQSFKPCNWNPRTRWDGCRIVEEGRPRIISLDYIERGCLLINTSLLTPGGRKYYVDDMIDADMALRTGN
jgi:hypothetical protein